MKLIFPIILVALSVAAFFMYIDPTYDRIEMLRAEEEELNSALERSQELIAIRDSLLAKYNSFPTEDIARVEQLLPDNIDNVRLILDLDGIAQTHGIVLQEVVVAQSSTSSSAPKGGGPLVPQEGGSQNTLGVADLSFSVTAPYEVFMNFLTDLEQSLRVVDIVAVSVQGTGNDLVYSLTMNTYWLE